MQKSKCRKWILLTPLTYTFDVTAYRLHLEVLSKLNRRWLLLTSANRAALHSDHFYLLPQIAATLALVLDVVQKSALR